MPVKFTVAAEINEDGSYRCGVESPDGSPVNLLDVVSFFNRAQGDAIGKMVVPPTVESEPPSEG